MSHLRQVTKRHSHYLVRYECDQKLQVRTAGFFETGEKIIVGKTYNVQWGLSKKDTDTAVVLSAGTNEECQAAMKTAIEDDKKKKRKATTAETSRPLTAETETRPPSSEEESNMPPPQQAALKTATEDGKKKKRKATTAEGVPPKKTVCRPLRLALPSMEESAATLEDTSRPLTAETETRPPSSPVEESNMPPPREGPEMSLIQTDEPPVPSTENEPTQNQVLVDMAMSSPTTPGLFPLDGAPLSPVTPRAYRQSGIGSLQQLLSTVNVLVNQNSQLIKDNRKLQQCVERQAVLMSKMNTEINELSQKVDTVSVKISSLNKDDMILKEAMTSTPQTQDVITSDYALSDSEIHSIKADSNNAGHFGANLVRRLFPELFGIGNYRLDYNWYGGGKLGKKELCKERKYLVKQYVTRYFPEHRDESSFKDCIVPKVNELLRRKEKGKEKENCGAETLPLQDTSFSTYLNLLNF